MTHMPRFVAPPKSILAVAWAGRQPRGLPNRIKSGPQGPADLLGRNRTVVKYDLGQIEEVAVYRLTGTMIRPVRPLLQLESLDAYECHQNGDRWINVHLFAGAQAIAHRLENLALEPRAWNPGGHLAQQPDVNRLEDA